MSSIEVVLDANVLIPAGLSDTLLRAAEAALYRPYWSDEILDEVVRNLVEHGMATEALARRRIAYMREAFPEATVANYQDIMSGMSNAPKDRHVLVAAVTARVQAIVTLNLRGFPYEALKPHNIQAQSPDEFLMNLSDLDPHRMMAIITSQAAALQKPPKTVIDVLSAMRRHVPLFTARVLELYRGAEPA